MRLLFSFIIISILSVGCTTTKYIPIESVKTDSVYIVAVSHDTLQTLDSVYIREKGDTVYYERWRTQYKSVYRTDTMLVTERDTIRVPYEVQVEKKASFADIAKMYLAIFVLIILFGIFVYFMFKKRSD